jgi:hypothetical protein
VDMFCCVVSSDLSSLRLSCKIMSSDLQDFEDELIYDESSSYLEVGKAYCFMFIHLVTGKRCKHSQNNIAWAFNIGALLLLYEPLHSNSS